MRGFKYLTLALLCCSGAVFAIDTDGDGYDDSVDLFPADPLEWIDSDGDGTGNNSDLDIDDDGIENLFDPDDDGDGALDDFDPLPKDPSEWLDSDFDGLGNNTDTDDDNDGVPDLVDVFPLNAQESLDSDKDGLGNKSDPDDDTNAITGEGDGVLDIYDQFPLDPLETIDTDFDGIGNNADLDDDGDGVNDVDDAFPLNFNVNADEDGDGVGNAQDPDIDGDGIVNSLDIFPYDKSEWYDTDLDGIGNNADLDDDTHNGTGVGDGILDVDDDLPTDPTETVDTDNDGIGNNADDDDDGDGVQDALDKCPLDALERLDTDNDGICDGPDLDADNDAEPDASDAFPLNSNEQKDVDADGVGDRSDADIDGDGVTNGSFVSGNYNDPLDLVFSGNDIFPFNPLQSVDTDGDGLGDFNNNGLGDLDDDDDGVDDSLDAFPLDAGEWQDTDGDGVGNNADADDDDDGINDFNPDGSILDPFPVDLLETRDTDGDGIGNNSDTDDDNDGVIDGLDAFPFDSLESADNDGDGIGNNADPDDDNDGHLDIVNGIINDEFPFDPLEWLDTDADGQGNEADNDDDGDGTLDENDLYPLNANEQFDHDGDGIGDNADADDDNDGFSDAVDVFDYNPLEWFDTDSDGLGNNEDTDDDNDTFTDNIDLFPLDITEWLDADNDGIGDNADADDDNDGIRDIDDAFPNNPVESVDTDNDGLGNVFDNDDDTHVVTGVGDGVLDIYDQFPLDPLETLDTDLDNVGNNADLDDDGDGMEDTFEALYFFDPLNPADGLLDTDGDGKKNSEEAIPDENGKQHNPLIDDYPPVITPPQAVNIDANHTFTELTLDALIDLTQVSVIDGLDGENCCNLTALGFETGAKNIQSGLLDITWQAVDRALNSTEIKQVLNIYPLVSFAEQQTVAEGGTARINVMLSGISPVYPVELPFFVSGSVDAADYNLGVNKVVINEGVKGFVDISFNTDFEVEGQETLILTFDPSVNTGAYNEHIIHVVETNVAPNITLSLEQNAIETNQIASDLAEATITLTISDSNTADTHIIDWQLPDYLSAQISANQLQVSISPTDIVLPEDNKGLIEVSVTVTDSGNTTNSGSEPLAQTKHFAFSLVDSLALLSTTDTDRDGVSDIVEGYVDTDNDGLPEYLDVSSIAYLQPLHTNSSIVKLVETEPGLHLQLGKYARLQFSDGVHLSQVDMDATGLIPLDTLVNQGGYFDFVIDDITPFGQSVLVVLPLSQSIEAHAVYRKFTPTNGWQDFVIDTNNAVASSEAVNGVCPPPQSDLYQEGLIVGNDCLRLLIEDGGANDNDGIANGVIDDPGGIAIISDTDVAKATVPEKSSSGSFSYLFLIGFTALMFFRLSPAQCKVKKI